MAISNCPHENKGHDLSWDHWIIILCKYFGRYVSGSLVEHSNLASSYRGKFLVRLTIYLFLLDPTKEYYSASGHREQHPL